MRKDITENYNLHTLNFTFHYDMIVSSREDNILKLDDNSTIGYSNQTYVLYFKVQNLKKIKGTGWYS